MVSSEENIAEKDLIVEEKNVAGNRYKSILAHPKIAIYMIHVFDSTLENEIIEWLYPELKKEDEPGNELESEEEESESESESEKGTQLVSYP